MKHTSSIFVAQVREPPHISQAYDLSCDSQEELHFVRPLSSGLGAGCRMSPGVIQRERDIWSERLVHCTVTSKGQEVK